MTSHHLLGLFGITRCQRAHDRQMFGMALAKMRRVGQCNTHGQAHLITQNPKHVRQARLSAHACNELMKLPVRVFIAIIVATHDGLLLRLQELFELANFPRLNPGCGPTGRQSLKQLPDVMECQKVLPIGACHHRAFSGKGGTQAIGNQLLHRFTDRTAGNTKPPRQFGNAEWLAAFQFARKYRVAQSLVD